MGGDPGRSLSQAQTQTTIIQLVGFADQTAAILGRLIAAGDRALGKASTVCVTANLTVMEHTIGVDKARARLGQLAEQAAASEPVILTRRGERCSSVPTTTSSCSQSAAPTPASS